MKKIKLFDLYEKTYFHEMETKEKIINRIQVNFALLATGLATLIYMIRMVDHQQNEIIICFFYFFSFSCLITLTPCIKYLHKAFHGNTYQGMPLSKDIDQYRQEMIEYNQEIEKYNTENPKYKQRKVSIEDSVSNFVYEKFRDCSSHNTVINEERSSNIHQSIKWTSYSAIPFLLSSIFFIFGNLDSSSPKKETLTSNITLNHQLKEMTVTLNKINESIIENGNYDEKR